MIVAQGPVHTGEYAGQHWEIHSRNIRGAAPYELTVGGEFYATGDTVFDLLDELDEI